MIKINKQTTITWKISQLKTKSVDLVLNVVFHY